MKLKKTLFCIVCLVFFAFSGCKGSGASEFSGEWKVWIGDGYHLDYEHIIFDDVYPDQYTREWVYTSEYVDNAEYEGCQRVVSEMGTFVTANGEMTFTPTLAYDDQIFDCVDPLKDSLGVKRDDSLLVPYTQPYSKTSNISLIINYTTYSWVVQQ